MGFYSFSSGHTVEQGKKQTVKHMKHFTEMSYLLLATFGLISVLFCLTVIFYGFIHLLYAFKMN